MSTTDQPIESSPTSIGTSEATTASMPAAPVERLARAALGGVACFAAVVLAMHLLEPDFDPRDRFVSEYVLGDWGLLMNAGFLALSIGTISLGLALGRALAPSRRTRVVRGLYVCGGVATIVAGVFNSDELVDGEVVEVTAQGAIHDLASFVLFGTLIVATFLLRKVFAATPGWEHRAMFPAIVGTMLIVGLVATAAPTDWFGLAQRAFVVVIVGWLGLQAAWLLAADGEDGSEVACGDLDRCVQFRRDAQIVIVRPNIRQRARRVVEGSRRRTAREARRAAGGE
jgi:hypothetical protein